MNSFKVNFQISRFILVFQYQKFKEHKLHQNFLIYQMFHPPSNISFSFIKSFLYFIKLLKFKFLK